MKFKILVVVFLGVVISAAIKAEFFSPGPYQDLSVREITVTQDCDEEFTCRSNSFNSTDCESKNVCTKVVECTGRNGFPPREHPLVDWQSSQSNPDTPGCSLIPGLPQNPPLKVSSWSDQRTLLVNGSATDLSPCYTQRTDPPNSSFSLVFWLKADCRNCSVLEIPQAGAESIHLRVVESSLCVNADCPASLPKGQWRLITVRANMNEVTFFIGENEINFHQSDLSNVAVDNLYIGSSEIIPMADVFELLDVRFYSDVLTPSEITELATGLMLPVNFQNCRCPIAFPVMDDSDDQFCTDGSSIVPRYNKTVHFNSPEVMLDENRNSLWASSDTGIVTLTLDLGKSFQIGSIRIIFTSALPSAPRIESTFVSDSRDMQTRTFTCTRSECIIDLSQQNDPDTMDEYKELRAEAIKISMHRSGTNQMESFVISEIIALGRCDCNGNAKSCTYDQVGGYECACDATTNTRGATCDTCTLNFVKSPNKFGCPLTCSCDPAGVTNVNDMCDQVNGLCKCKSNVEGADCDQCKPFTYNLLSINPDGCSFCNCNLTGAVSCSNITGECQCRDNTVSDLCDQCSDDSYSFVDGCKPCDCLQDGTLNQKTDCTDAGQCYCKENVMGRRCDHCKAGYYDLSLTSVTGCKACSCHSVGAEHQTCDTLTGQCTCRGGINTDMACNPVITSIDPSFGPEMGGTMVTIKGQLFGNESHSVSVFLGDDLQQVIEKNDETIIFSSQRYNDSGSRGSGVPSLQVKWDGNGITINTPFTFKYLRDPVLDTSRNSRLITYLRGGCPVEIYGSDLQNVKYPRVEMTNLGNSGKAVYMTCNHKPDRLLCFTPDLSGIQSSAGSNDYEMSVLLDGMRVERDVTVLSDPIVNNAGNIKFQYPFEDTVSLSGKNLLSSCPVKVYLGVVSCELKHLSDTGIEFAPPVSPPGGSKKNNIEIHVGEMKFSVGTLEYLEFYETTGFIIIVSCIGATILIVILAIVICCCCRIRRDHAAPITRNNANNKMANGANNKQMVEVDNRPMNTYSELVTLVDAPDAPAVSNVYNSPIRMETVVREHKKGIVNSEAEDSILAEEFLPRVEPGIRDDVKKCYIGSGHFVPGRICLIRGRHTQLVDGTLQKNGTPVQKLTIKSVIGSLPPEQDLPMWATLALSECLRLRRFKHNHIVSIIGIGVNKNQFHILYPNMLQGILKSVVSDTNKDFSVRQLLGFSQQVAEGIDFLSSKDVTHKDVAARNCMIDEFSVVKLSDASFSWDLYPDEYVYDQAREKYMPIRWMAPESLLDGYYDMRTDVWSFAVLVWELLTRGCLPFHEVTDSAGVSEYILQGYILGRPDTLSSDVYELLRSCWSPENEARPAIATVSRTLSEILEAEDDETYANAGELASFEHQHSSGLAATPRQHNGGGNLYSTTKLSRV